MKDIALYIHWPFCKSKCPYCDFNSHVTQSVDEARWQAAYLKELDYFAKRIGPRRLTSMFFGGGTPSLMPPALVAALIKAAGEHFTLAPNMEITLEMNPTSIEAAKLEQFSKAGVNRVSIGVQALNAKDLKFLGREHSADEAIAAIKTASSIFKNYSFDLMYARPGQSVAEWEAELTEALKLAGPHLSLYQLTIEKGTPFYAAYERGEFELPNEDIAAEMYEVTEELLLNAGYEAYEISNYAKPGFECRHNITYWRYADYLGIGPGAHGRIQEANGRSATMMLHAPENWLKSVEEKGHGTQSDTKLTQEEVREEAIMMGLRLIRGIDAGQFTKTTGMNLWKSIDREMLDACVQEGLLEKEGNVIRASFDGRLVLSPLTAALLGNEQDEGDED